MPTLTTVAGFNFAAGDGAPVEAVHTSLALVTVTSSGYLGIGANRLVNLFANATNQIVRDTNAYTNNQFVRGTVGGFTGGGNTRAQVFAVQVSADTGGAADFYAAIIYNTTPRQTDLVRVDNGVPTVLASSTAVAWVDADQCVFLILDGGLAIYRNGALTALTYADASPLAGGTPGFGHRDVSGGPVLWIANADTGNVTADVLSAISGGATLDGPTAGGGLGVVPATCTVPGLKTPANLALPAEVVPVVTINRASDGAPVAQLANVLANGAGDLVLAHGALVAGTWYMVTGWSADTQRRFILPVQAV